MKLLHFGNFLFFFIRPFGLCYEVITEKTIEEYLVPCVVCISKNLNFPSNMSVY